MKFDDADDDDNDYEDDDELFLVMVDRRKVVCFISSQDHCHRSSPSQISDTVAGFVPAHKISSGLVESSCAVVITTTSQLNFVLCEVVSEIKNLHRRLGMFFLYSINFLGCSHFKMTFIP